MKKSILDVIKEKVLFDLNYRYFIDIDEEECTISIHFDTKVIYQSLFERFSKVTPLLKRNGFSWQVYINIKGNLSVMIY